MDSILLKISEICMEIVWYEKCERVSFVLWHIENISKAMKSIVIIQLSKAMKSIVIPQEIS